ncbi:aminotransferase class V-fold PLP-dependent enzyme [Saccharicrinis sp. FJH62]|uniref:aminotransferase class V-fold PLP-dependent enzyme n=1 Tax=Saccharicrinis sp. FJH62 TaxID=3344657 RepID=UPI0035D46AD8
MDIWKEVRKEFPVCKEFVYLNPAGGSPLSASAAQQARQFYDEILAQGDNLYEEWLERTEVTRQMVAEYIGADASEIAFTTNTSHGMNLVAQMNKNKGKVLTMHDEFPSSTFPWLNQGVALKMVEPKDGFRYPIEKIEASLDPDVKILMTSYVQYCTGFRQDLEALGELCRRKNLIFVVNATQAIPVFPVDVKKWNIDFLVFTGLKWATAGYGIGGLYISKKWLTGGKLPFAGWLSIEDPEQMDNLKFEPEERASVVESGCPHFAPVFALKGALELFKRIGKEQVTSHVLGLTTYLQKKLKALGAELTSPEDEKHMSGITIIKTTQATELVSELRDKNIIVSPRGQGVRVSVNIFNNKEDIDVLIEALEQHRDLF